MIPLAFHPFLFCSQKRNGWSPKKKPPPISLCLISVPVGGWPETRCAQTVGPEFPPPFTSIAPSGPARLRMGGEAVPCGNGLSAGVYFQARGFLVLAGSMCDVMTFVSIASETARLRTNFKIPFSSPAIRSPAGPKGCGDERRRIKQLDCLSEASFELPAAVNRSKAEQDGRRFSFFGSFLSLPGQRKK